MALLVPTLPKSHSSLDPHFAKHLHSVYSPSRTFQSQLVTVLGFCHPLQLLIPSQESLMPSPEEEKYIEVVFR